MTTIVSWTLAGPGTAPIIGDALRSVAGIADRSIVINTTGQLAGDIWQATRHTGTSVDWREWLWRGDFAAARNEALEASAEENAEWALMLDSDERVICPESSELHGFLEALPPQVMVALAHHDDGSHTRERFFRLPCPFRFVGRTHETMAKGDAEQVIIPRSIIQWSELPKSPTQLRTKFLRDVDMLRADLADDPKNGAAHYYLGETLQSLGQHEEAIACFREHNELSKWEEGRAWACFKAAESYFALRQPYRVLECAAQGLVHDAGIAELYWIAATACWAQAAAAVADGVSPSAAWQWVEQARCWGEAARAHGAGSEAEARRVGKRDVRGLGSGVDEVLAAVRAVKGTA